MRVRSVLAGATFSLVLLSSLGARADFAIQDHLKGLACQKELKAAIPAKLLSMRWRPKFQSLPLQPLFASLEFRNSKDGSTYEVFGNADASYYSVNTRTPSPSQTLFKCDSKSGLVKSAEALRLPASLPASGGFTDTDLVAKMKTNKKGLIYVWSPHMPLSVHGLAEIRGAAKDQGLDLTIVMDHDAHLKDAEAWVAKGDAKKSDLLRLESAELLNRDVALHYPVTLMYQNGFLSNHSFVGHKPRKGFNEWIKQESVKLKAEAGVL